MMKKKEKVTLSQMRESLAKACGIERRTTDTAFETGFLDAVENILTVEYFTHRTMREHDDYVVGYRYGRLSCETHCQQIEML